MTGRMRRVNEAVRQVLSEAVGELKDPRIGFVTVTGVDTSSDLRHARVYVSVLGAEKTREQSLAGLAAAHGFMQLEGLGRALPDDWRERALVAVDCANESRLGHDLELLTGVDYVIDIDHHHDNTRFGNVNLVVPNASSTGEVLRDVLAELGV